MTPDPVAAASTPDPVAAALTPDPATMRAERAASLKRRVHARLLAGGPGAADADRIAGLLDDEAPLLGGRRRADLVAELMADVSGLGRLEPLLADPAVSEVMVNGPGPVWVERTGVLERTEVVLDVVSIEHVIEKVVAPLGLRIDRSSPLVDARLADGSRVNAVVPPLAVDGPCLTIRRFGARAVPLGAFCAPGVARFLEWAVEARFNIVVSGATGAGKTTLLNALGAHIPRSERVITIEDAAELRLPGDHVVRLEARPPNAEGAGEVRVRDLVRNALRMRPDRIVVGEVRGPEALDMLQAMNTGHEGSLSTCHANSPADALRRLETMVLMSEVALPLGAVRDQLVASLDLIVQVVRRPGGARAVAEVAEVLDAPAPVPADSPAPLPAEVLGAPAGPSAGPVAGPAAWPAGSAARTRRLAGPEGVVALPGRPSRNLEAGGPDPAWLETP